MLSFQNLLLSRPPVCVLDIPGRGAEEWCMYKLGTSGRGLRLSTRLLLLLSRESIYGYVFLFCSI